MPTIGQPIDRIDGPAKASGLAIYASEHWEVGQPLYGFIVGATIGKGRITRIDTTRAERDTTAFECSRPMEPDACLALWRGDDLTVYVSAQVVHNARTSIASTLRIDPERVHIVTPYVGGGFGSKLGIHSETILAAF